MWCGPGSTIFLKIARGPISFAIPTKVHNLVPKILPKFKTKNVLNRCH